MDWFTTNKGDFIILPGKMFWGQAAPWYFLFQVAYFATLVIDQCLFGNKNSLSCAKKSIGWFVYLIGVVWENDSNYSILSPFTFDVMSANLERNTGLEHISSTGPLVPFPISLRFHTKCWLLCTFCHKRNFSSILVCCILCATFCDDCCCNPIVCAKNSKYHSTA